MGQGFLLVELPQSHLFRCYGCHYPRSHHVISLDVVELYYVLDNLVLALVEDAFLLAYVGHCGYLFPAYGHVSFFLLEQFRKKLDEHDERIHDYDQEIHHVGKPEEAFPAGRADGLRNDFREHQDQYRHYGGHEPEPFASEDYRGLAADSCCTDSVGYGVQGKDSRYRPVYVLLKLVESCCVLASFLLPHGDIGKRGGHKRGFEQRTQE